MKDFSNSIPYRSEKVNCNPKLLISEAISSVMIHALLRNIKIKTIFENDIDTTHLSSLRLRIIISSIIFQAIDTTPNGGEISVLVKRLSIDNSSYLHITIVDESYQLCDIQSNSCFIGFEYISFENLKKLILLEGGTLNLENFSTTGKCIQLKIPLDLDISNCKTARKNNVFKIYL